MTAPDFTDATWRTSSYSGSNGGECVEVAFAERAVGVRDSKHRDGAVLTVTAADWRAFLHTVAKHPLA